MGLAQASESDFQRHGLHTAQVLLTHDDFSSRVRYLNARSTLRSLLGFGVVPVVNENDTVSTEQIALGDNDTLAGLVANLMEAQLMVVLTDQDGLYSSDPRVHSGAELVSVARAGDPALEAMAGDGGTLGRGGMRSKLRAAALAARSGTATRIVGGRGDRVLLRLAEGEPLGTLLEPAAAPMAARKRWMAGQVKTGGRLELDAGAAHMVRNAGKSLLAVGVRGVSGQFDRGEIVGCYGPDGVEVARGLVNYGASEVRRIVGVPSNRIAEALGYVNEPELIHRDNLVMID
ncbi:MAG: glutamate 5-kinase, partial [Gammaproteobacteria bacterium]